MKYYVVIDTNVIVSALLTKHENASTLKVLKEVFGGNLNLLYSEPIMEEYKAVLRRPKFKFDKNLVDFIVEGIAQFGELVNPSSSKEILKDPKDVMFYDLVLFKISLNPYLITGNIKHFPFKPFIVTPKEFLDLVKL